MNRNHFRLLPIVLAGLYILFKFFMAPTFVNPETGRKSRVGLDPQQEQALGLQSYQEVLSKSQVIDSGPQVDMIKGVARRLASAAAEKGSIRYNWQLSVVQSDQANAFCLPGGEIVVYTGILPIAQGEAGLATVLGHEMAHATSRHGAQRMFQQQIEQTAMMGAQGSLWNMDYAHQQAVMSALGAATQHGAILPFSRKHESEADHIGLLYMARAGYDPQEAIQFWQRMTTSAGAGQPPQFFSDHPSDGHRIEQLQALLPGAEKEYAASTMKDTGSPTQQTGL